MARFFFLDQSLKGVGGHHFDYAQHVVRAAEEMGFETVLGTHRRFRDEGKFSDDCQVHTVFRHTIYNRHSDFSPSRERTWRSWVTFGRIRVPTVPADSPGRQRIALHFRRDLARLFSGKSHRQGDHVFLATISDVELLGLAHYLQHEPTSKLATWHCQFHFNIFRGRPHEYAAQTSSLQISRSRFAEALELLRDHDIRFYTTSHELTEQYRQLGLANFDNLAYPINPRFQAETTAWDRDASRRGTPRHSGCDQARGDPPGCDAVEPDSLTGRPLRITLARAVRKEKGQRELAELLDAVAPSLLCSKRVSFVIQRKRRARFRRPQLDEIQQALRKSGVNMNDAIHYVDHPLDAEAYEAMMKQADVGLFLYDGRRYYARRAGVLGEYLSLGVPVIVPAGCWLSEQVRQANEEYRHHIARDAPPLPIAFAGNGATSGNATPSPISSFDSEQASVGFTLLDDHATTVRVTLDRPCAILAIQCRIRASAGSPGFVRCEYDQHDVAGSVAPAPMIAGVLRGSGDDSVSLHLPLYDAPTQIDLRLRSAYGEPAIEVKTLQVKAIATPEHPLGVVGLVAADRQQVPRLLQEVQTHYAHYRRTAAAFAKDWYATHKPRQVMRQLLRNSSSQRRVA